MPRKTTPLAGSDNADLFMVSSYTINQLTLILEKERDGNTEKQLIVIADTEGASGIFERNREAFFHAELYQKSTFWRD